MKKTYIWSLPTRIFHHLLSIFILAAFLTDDDKLINYHSNIGYVILILLIFRLFWGFIGPKYSLFKEFPININEAKEFMKNIFKSEQKYVGHNPMASYVMIAILVTTFLVIISGVLTLGIQEGKGVLSFLNSEYFKKMKLFEDIHEFLANFLIVLVVGHLCGIAFDRIFHKKHQTLNSIFTGYKMVENIDDIKLNIFQKIFFFIVVVLFFMFVFFAILKPSNILTASIYEPIDYKAQNIAFVNECGSCHTLYPPSLLPKKSWKLIMSDLENHFGDDAAVDREVNENILSFLIKNSAENSTMEASWNFINSIGNSDIIALSKTDYWEKRHKDIPKYVFKNEKVKSVANCKACHSDIEKGLIEDENIKDISDFM